MAWWQWFALWWGALCVVFSAFYMAFGVLRKQTPAEWRRRTEAEAAWQRQSGKLRRRPF
jgi:hypothetical protein